MIKSSLGIALCLYLLSPFANAHESDRINELELEVQKLKVQLLEIKALLPDSPKEQIEVSSSDGWQSISNWRKLKNDMSTDDVSSLLGEPVRIDGGSISTWHYPKNANVLFFNGHVHRWSEPR